MVAGDGVLAGKGDLKLLNEKVRVFADAVLAGTGTLDTVTTSLVLVPAVGVLTGLGGMLGADSIVVQSGDAILGGFGEVRAYPLFPETFYVNGIDVFTCGAYVTPDLSGLGTVPAKRTGNVAVPGRHGAVRTPRKRYDVNTFALQIWVKGVNLDGTIPQDPHKAYYANLDRLYRMFSGEITLEHVLPDSSSRVLTVEVLDQIDYTRRFEARVGSIGLTMTAVDPFWRGKNPVKSTVSSNGSPTLGPLAAFAESTAPVEDAILVFTGPLANPSVRCGDYWVKYNDVLGVGQTLTIDVGNWSLSSPNLVVDYRKLQHAGIGAWLALTPAEGGPVVEFDHTGVTTGSVTITARNAYLGG